MLCKECGDIIAHEQNTIEFSTIVDKIESGCSSITDLEESIYFNAYCTSCARRFLVDEKEQQPYNDQ